MKKQNNNYEEIWKVLKKSKKVLIPLHPRPDGDSLGCSAAMSYMLENEGVKTRIISKDPITENIAEGFDFWNEVVIEDLEKTNLEEYDWILLLDHGYPGYYSEEFIEKNKEKIVNLDHHDTNSFFGEINYVEIKPSGCSLVYDFCVANGIGFDKALSRRILLGICTDTNFGEYGNGETLKQMGNLVDRGEINYQKEFVNPIINSNPWKLKKLHGILLTNMEKKVINGKTVAYSWAEKKDYDNYGLNYTDIRLGIFCMQDIKEVDLVFVLTEMEDEIKGGFRSQDWDTTIYSTAFGGGGHKKASAFIVEKEDMAKVVEKVLGVIEEKGFVEAE